MKKYFRNLLFILFYFSPWAKGDTYITKHLCVFPCSFLSILQMDSPFIIKVENDQLLNLDPIMYYRNYHGAKIIFGKGENPNKTIARFIFKKIRKKILNDGHVKNLSYSKDYTLKNVLGFGVKYSYIIDNNGRIFISITERKSYHKLKRFGDLLVSKHSLLNNVSTSLLYAGELVREGEFVVFNNDSGTYRPDEKYLDQVGCYLHGVFYYDLIKTRDRNSDKIYFNSKNDTNSKNSPCFRKTH